MTEEPLFEVKKNKSELPGTTSFEDDGTRIPPKNAPFCLKMSTFSKVLATGEKWTISPRKWGNFHRQARKMPPSVLAWPAEQYAGR